MQQQQLPPQQQHTKRVRFENTEALLLPPITISIHTMVVLMMVIVTIDFI